jgi:diphthamide biosynthesis protein 7
MVGRPLVSAEVGTGGGAWRLKWHPRRPQLLLAACMYAGFAVLRASAAWDGLQLASTYTGHDSIGYGADWWWGGGGGGGGEAAAAVQPEAQSPPGEAWLVATASFYDRRLHLWSAPL